MKVLVTGGAGLIGSNLVRVLSLEHEVFVADNLWRGKLENLTYKGKSVLKTPNHFKKLDLRQFDNCLEAIRGVDAVFHLADIVAGINYVFSNQHALFRDNLLINTNVLQATIDSGVKNYIYVGTACSFPAEKQNRLNPPPLKESDTYPANPESSYGWSKLMGEYEAELAQKEGKLNVGIVRFHNVYGPPCEVSPERSQVIPALCRKAIRHPEEEFVVWGSGQQRRAFVYVDDVVESLLSVWKKGMNRGMIQIGPSESHSIASIAEEIVRISGKRIPIRFDTTKREGDKDRTADYSLAQELLGWKPKTDIKTGLQKTYEWCQRYLTQGV